MYGMYCFGADRRLIFLRILHENNPAVTQNLAGPTMTAGEQLPSHEKPYSWDSEPVPPRDVLQLWTEVGNGIDKSQTGA